MQPCALMFTTCYNKTLGFELHLFYPYLVDLLVPQIFASLYHLNWRILLPLFSFTAILQRTALFEQRSHVFLFHLLHTALWLFFFSYCSSHWKIHLKDFKSIKTRPLNTLLTSIMFKSAWHIAITYWGTLLLACHCKSINWAYPFKIRHLKWCCVSQWKPQEWHRNLVQVSYLTLAALQHFSMCVFSPCARGKKSFLFSDLLKGKWDKTTCATAAESISYRSSVMANTHPQKCRILHSYYHQKK